MFVFIGLIFIAFGVLYLVKPDFAWYINEGWKVKGDSEPSEGYLMMTRFGGVVLLIVGTIFLLSLFF
ncbi:hypothetical protein D3P07_17310 [Paenibacillus sp. 1011MAR3C5]|uniref:DUF6199 family natural product biosynthesis protein n=1 Tax=Paenibacillus sp. 1011MAR3C5 TaxID=1675787 RepID=UPI000E6BC71E|nr:DUF6199 family natural product biosynthesis protein [Paenibacillus sp. 1011MAR3C5]RJE86939.1 hypothetical protein D3P07_17310 [Paenibacillus sp. 1011MAR3C5]